MWETIRGQWQASVTLAAFIILTIFWIFLQVIIPNEKDIHKFFGAVYGVIALWGAIWGVGISLKWGGIKSVMGRAILMFSLGLFAQEFGQVVLSFYDYYLHIEGSYPSLGDVGYFGSIPLYIYGIVLLAQASGVKIALRSFTKQIQALIIPIAMLILGYSLFLKGYKLDWSNPIKVYLDFGYPLGEAIYISIAIVTYLLSRSVLGGIMRSKILFILFALCVQFLSDYTFLYQSSKGTWHVGQINDYMYLVAYFLMSLGLMQLGTVVSKLKNTR